MGKAGKSAVKFTLPSLILATLIALLGVLPAWSQGRTPYTLAEYNAFQAASQQTDPVARIQACDDFVSKFPNSVLLPLVYQIEYQSYNQLKNYPETIETVDKFLAVPEDSFTSLKMTKSQIEANRTTALYVRSIAFLASSIQKDTNAQDESTKAREDALEGLKDLEELPKPTNQTDEQFIQSKKQVRIVLNLCAGRAAVILKDNKDAIDSYNAVLRDSPNDTIARNFLKVLEISPEQMQAVVAEESAGDAAVQQDQLRGALQHYEAALQSLPEIPPTDTDQRLREKIIKAVLQLNPPPAIPQDAIRHAAYAETAVEEAKNPSDLNDAINELQQALRVAPWWAQAYFNLGAVLQKVHRPADAAAALQLYLLADPHASNAQDVQMEVYKLQYEAKKQQEGNSQN